MNDPSEYVDFMVKYKEWISIKRLGIRDVTKPEEIVNHLAVVRSSIDNHAYKIMGIDTSMLEKYAQKLAMDRKKSYDSLSDAIKDLQSPEAKKVIRESSPGETVAKIAESYLLNAVISAMKFQSGITPELMGKLYPDVKTKMPMGVGRKKK